MNKTQVLEDTGERMIPEFHKGNFVYGEHMVRYKAVQPLVTDKVVVDIACGSGYGSSMLAASARQVTGIDIDKASVAYAAQHYSASNIDYVTGSGTDIPLESGTVDVVISFETIEHINDYQKFLQEIKRILKIDGFAIISTPNDLEFSQENHFHVHQFTNQELKQKVKEYFNYQNSYFQGAWVMNAIFDEAMFTKEWIEKITVLNMSPKQLVKATYFTIIASNQPLDSTITINPIAGISEHWSQRESEKERKLTEDHINNLGKIIESVSSELKQKEEALTSITNSKSWRMVQKLARINPRLRRK